MSSSARVRSERTSRFLGPNSLTGAVGLLRWTKSAPEPYVFDVRSQAVMGVTLTEVAMRVSVIETG